MEEIKPGTIRFQRREVLKILAALPATALGSSALFAAALAKAMPSRSDPQVDVTPFEPRAFDPHQWQAVRVLCDLIIPADHVSGSATEAGVPEFIDDWLDIKGGTLLTEIRAGLAWLDKQCNQSFDHRFTDCTVD